MTPRRFAAGVAVAAFAVPLLATAPHPRAATPAPAAGSSLPPRTSERVLARADAAPVSPGPAQAARARAEYDAWAAGKPDIAHYVAGAPANLTAAIPQVQSLLQTIGPVKTFAFQTTTTAHGMTVAIYLVTAGGGSVQELISWDASGRIQLIVFRPVPG